MQGLRVNVAHVSDFELKKILVAMKTSLPEYEYVTAYRASEYEADNYLFYVVGANYRVGKSANWLFNMQIGTISVGHYDFPTVIDAIKDVINERIYCELVLNNNTSEAIHLHNAEHEKFVKSMKNTPSVIRTEYAYALLAQKDENKANQWLSLFEKVAKTYPYPRDIEGERELIAKIVDERNNN